MRTTIPSKLLPAILVGIALLLPTPAFAGQSPVKEVVASHIGWEANETTGGTLCTVLSGDKCQPARRSSEPGGFESAVGVAVNDDPASSRYHDVYVVDGFTHRVDVLSSTGQYVSSFGAHGTAPGQIETVHSIAVDPADGDVYVLESVSYQSGFGSSERMQEFTAEGTFVLEVGKGVNETTHGNICTEEEVKAEGVNCTVPAPAASGKEHEAFSQAHALASEPGGVLYVGEAGRVQELEADGRYKGELALPASAEAGAIAVDASGDVYVTFVEDDGVIYELNPGGQRIGEFKLTPREPGVALAVQGLAFDPAGRLAVTEFEEGHSPHQFEVERGVLYDTTGNHLRPITEFAVPGNMLFSSIGVHSLVFNDKDELFAVDFYDAFYHMPAEHLANEVIAYTPVPVGELSAGAPVCSAGTESESDASFDCVLNGEVNPFGVLGTEAWFVWGSTPSLGQRTPNQGIAGGSALVPISAPIDGLRPNEELYYQVAGEDANIKSPEVLASETTSVKMQSVSPRIVGEPSVAFVKPYSAVVGSEVNPENANTDYYVEYAPETPGGEHSQRAARTGSSRKPAQVLRALWGRNPRNMVRSRPPRK